MANSRMWLIAAALLIGAGVIVAAAKMKPSSPVAPEPDRRVAVEAPMSEKPSPPAGARGDTKQAPAERRAINVAPGNGNDVFRTDAAGELVLDEQTRLDIEALVAQADAANLHSAVREHTDSLPPAAARQAEDLVDKFIYYQEAQRLAYPPDDAPLTEEDAIRQLEGLHGLREAHFGSEVAQKLFGREEAIGREMIEVVRLENDQSLTSEEKLQQAEALRSQLPEVAAIERGNRESAAAQERPE